MKKLSIIVPAYNSEEYLETALKSIPLRDDVEVIIINDGSTDKTKQIAEKWAKDKDAKVINLKENRGLGNAKNVGYDNATGEYINQLDSDDYLYTEEYEKVIDQLDGTDIVYMNLEQNNGTILDVGSNPEYFCSGCARFIKREFLGDLRCPETRYAEDWHLTQELNKKQHTDKFTGIVAYHYNFPREGSLVDQAQKGLIQDTAPGRQKRIILWQSYFCPIGGVETFAYNWCLQLREYYDITVLCIDGDAKQLSRLRKLVKVEKIDRNKKYYADILIRNSVWQRLPENIIAPRIIEMQHANYKYLYETSQFKDQYVKAPGNVEHIACGEFVAKMYEEVEGIKIPFIRNILAPKKKTEKIYRFLTCSRIEDEAKGWKRMAKMCDMMTQAGMKYEWIVFSKQPPDTYIPPQVHFYEPQFDVFDYIGDAAIDYSVLLSDSEGLPLQILESIQYQKPCIVTDVGGCTELIKDGVNGYVVPLDMNFDINRIKDIPKLKPYKGTTAKDWCDYLGDAEYVKKPIKEEPKETGLVKIQALCEYFDTKVNRDIKTDEVYEVTETRAKEIIKADLAVLA